MTLPFKPPYPPMEAKRVEKIPRGEGWQYEPKWDGFRVLIFRDGDDVHLQSKSGQPLARYFPEIVEIARSAKDTSYVLDGEIVIVSDGRISFDDLQLRLHPAESRVRKLAAEIPAQVVVFDLLAEGLNGKAGDLRGQPLADRRQALERWMENNGVAGLSLSPATTDPEVATGWQNSLGGIGLDGVMAKRLEMKYRSGERTGMQKIKQFKDADCVIGGVRYKEGSEDVAVVLLGLYDGKVLRHVGNISSLGAATRAEISDRIRPLAGRGGFDEATLGGPSRWSNMKESHTTEPVPVEPQLVVEVTYDYFNQGRFRHGAKFIRWRPDKKPKQCTIDQVAAEDGDPELIASVLG